MRLHAQIKTGGAAKGKQRSGGSRGGDAPVAGKRVGQVPLWRGATRRRLPAKRPVTPLASADMFAPAKSGHGQAVWVTESQMGGVGDGGVAATLPPPARNCATGPRGVTDWDKIPLPSAHSRLKTESEPIKEEARRRSGASQKVTGQARATGKTHPRLGKNGAGGKAESAGRTGNGRPQKGAAGAKKKWKF
jgi:hypothetical protein